MATATEAPIIDAPAAALEVPVLLPFRCDDTRLMQLSVSSLGLFWRCPERWKLRYIERRREPQTGAMVIGRAVGASIAAYFAAKMAGEPLSDRDADDLLAAEFDESAGRRDTDFGQDEPETLREQSREALRAYLTELAPSVRPRAVERRFELAFDGARWSIVGYLDVEDESGDTIDVKVGQKHVSEGRAATDPQPTLYRLARRAEGQEGGRFLFHSVRRGPMRSGERCLIVAAERTPAQLDAMEGRIAQTARQIALRADPGLAAFDPRRVVVRRGSVPCVVRLPGRRERIARRPPDERGLPTRPAKRESAERRTTMASMAVSAKKLDVKVGDLVEIEGRRYEVVANKAGGVALEPPVTKTAADLRAERGARPLTPEEFEELFGDLPSDGEG